MEDQIAVLSGLLIGLVLAVVLLFFVLWRNQRLYDMTVHVLNEVRDATSRMRTELYMRSMSKTNPEVKVDLAADLETFRKQTKQAVESLSKAAKDE